MDAFLDTLIAFASAHRGLAYGVLFLAALLEAVPVLGSLVPGSTIILALSALIPGGELDLVGVLASAAAGAVLGDGAAYLIGHREQRQILSAWPMSQHPELVARAEAFFQRFGGWAVFFARFVPPIRAFVPVTAGALQMTPARFFAINIPAILLWAPAHVLPGVVAATALEQSHGRLHHWLPVVAGVAALLLMAGWLLWRRRQSRALPK
ncbi:DedA family protein [Rhodopseudomonas sp. HC1]|uniref:DedA family protein n=1 Tax=Rhodopseudomonas infernalis TaxID=2897386 RepID=UPI001EE8EAC2|nr:DedA family protein [Rhodopseudomonas infernalis]MCG6206192.1 DedA family protein [Rhodopseudomonas infernalis]